MEDILKEVLEDIKPKKAEKKNFKKTKEKLIEKIDEVVTELGLSVKPMIVGSTARGTWLSGEHDIDLFLLFPKDTPRDELEEKGLEIGNKITGDKGREQYAEHPYVNAEIYGFDVDIVPCYDIEDPSKIRSAVDRSPHHQDYIKGWLTEEKSNQVLLLKKFMKGIGAYGSELETHGFSGYLCELLVAHIGPFQEVIRKASEWRKRTILDPEGERDDKDLKKLFPNQPLIFVDPVDPGRNVAAAVSMKNYAKFIRASQSFLREPKEEFFFPNEPTK